MIPRFYNYRTGEVSDVPEDPELWAMVPQQIKDRIESWSNGEFTWNTAYMHSAIVAGEDKLLVKRSPWGTYSLFVKINDSLASQVFPTTAEDWLAFCQHAGMPIRQEWQALYDTSPLCAIGYINADELAEYMTYADQWEGTYCTDKPFTNKPLELPGPETFELLGMSEVQGKGQTKQYIKPKTCNVVELPSLKRLPAGYRHPEIGMDKYGVWDLDDLYQLDPAEIHAAQAERASKVLPFPNKDIT